MIPRRRRYTRPALLAVTAAFLLSCGEGVTAPQQSLPGVQHAESSPESFSVQAAPEPVTVRYFDADYEEAAISTSNTPDGIYPVQPSGKTVATVPLFDPSLGQLLSARLVIDGWLAASMWSHGVSDPYVSSEYTVGFSAGTRLGPLLQSLTGQSAISLGQTWAGFHEDWADFCCAAQIHIKGTGTDTYAFDETYTGADAQVFVESSENDHPLRMYIHHERFLRARATHSGFTLSAFFEVRREPDAAASKPGIVTLINTAAALAFDHLDHDLYYSDLHTGGAAQFQMEVVYTYQPNRPPVCTEAVASVEELWPPDGRMVPIDILSVTDPDGDPVTITIAEVRHDEPNAVRGNREPSQEDMGVGTSTAHVTAERSGAGDGRIYEIDFSAEDGRGGSCSGTVEVSVPHDRRHAPAGTRRS